MTALEYLDQKLRDDVSVKTRYQLNAVKDWVSKGCKGSIEWPTGVGKTRIATEAIGVMRRDVPTRTFAVSVPTIQLKEQWEAGLAQLGMLENGAVYVINTLIRRKEPLEVELLILDEIHRYAAKTFSRVFDKVKYLYVLGLTATMKRQDKKHDILVQYAPIINRMSLLRARKDALIANFREYNLGIKMPDEDYEKYAELSRTYGYNLDKFHRDFSLMKDCSMGILPWYARSGRWVAPRVVAYAQNLGWRGRSPYEASEIATYNETAPRGEKRDMWGNENHMFAPQKLYINAINGMRAIRQIKEFIYGHPLKRDATVELITRFNRKTIVFGQLISRAEEIQAALPECTVMYHSKMKKKEKDFAMEQVTTNPSILAILTALSLDQGFDWSEVQLGIIESRTSSPIQQTQRRGRVVRLHTFVDGTEKEGVIINVYLTDTKDYDWLNKAQVGGTIAIWVNSVEEILRAEGLLEVSAA